MTKDPIFSATGLSRMVSDKFIILSTIEAHLVQLLVTAQQYRAETHCRITSVLYDGGLLLSRLAAVEKDVAHVEILVKLGSTDEAMLAMDRVNSQINRLLQEQQRLQREYAEYLEQCN